MQEVWGLAIAAAIGAVAWLYQKAWDRQQVRIARYQAIVDRLHAFTQEQLDPDKIEETLIEIRGGVGFGWRPFSLSPHCRHQTC
jgi:hypothetical protein